MAKKTISNKTQTEERYRMLIEKMNDGLGVVDAEWHLTFVNAALCKMWGYEEKELLGRSPMDLLDDGNKAFFLKQLELRKQGVSEPYEITWLGKKDKVVTLVNPTAIIDADGKLVESFAIITDITKFKKLEEEYKTILKTSIDAFWISDLKGKFLDANYAYCELIGYSREELLKMNIRNVEFVEDAEATTKHIEKIISQGSDKFETKHKRKNGEIINIEISVTYSKERERFYVFARNIADRKKMENKLQAKLLELERFNNIAMGREIRILQLKDELEQLKKEKEENQKNQEVQE